MTLPERTEKFRQWHQSRPRWLRLLLPFLAGSLTVLAMPPWSLWIALWPGFSALYILLAWSDNKKQAFWTGWLFGFGYFVFGLAWTANALTVDGSTYSWVIPLAIGGLPALLAFFTGLCSMLSVRFTRLVSIPGIFGFAGFITLSEWLRGHVLSGFPWNLYGYGWTGVDVAQTVSLFGIYGLTLFTVLWAALPGFLLLWTATRQRKTIVALCVYSLLAASFIWGHARLAHHQTLYNPKYLLRIVQPSIPQSMKWDAEKAIVSFRQTVEASEMNERKVPPDSTLLMIWPETAVQQDLMNNAEAQEVLRTSFSRYPANFYLATGMLRWEPRGEKMLYYNSIGIYDRDINLLETYDKGHLVPFGEYIPLGRWLPANPLVASDGFEHGPGASTMAIPPASQDPFQISPMVCYEVIFPGAIIQHGTKPQLMLNVTNDGWYGDTAGPRQHLAISRFRSIEEGLPMARAANTGISAVIDSYGRVLWQSKIFEVTARTMALPLIAAKPTLYSKAGDSIVLILMTLFILSSLIGRGFSARRK